MPGSTRFLTVLTIALAIVMFGLLTRQGTVLVLSIPLFLYCSASLTSLALTPIPQLEVRRSLAAERINENEETTVELFVANRGSRLPVVAVEDDVPDGAKLVDGDPRFLGVLPAGEGRTIAYTIRAERGRHRQKSVRIAVWPSFGLAFREAQTDHITAFSSLPRMEKLDSIDIRPRQTHAFAGPVRANVSGVGIEFFGCRAFAPGDDIRRVNWRASARREDIIINEYEQERMADVNLILDTRALIHVEVDEFNTFERAVRAAASIAGHFIHQGNRVGLLAYGDYLDWIYPNAGRIQLERILGALARAHMGSRAAFGALRRIPTRLFAAGSQLVIVGSMNNEEDAEVLPNLVARGYSVLLLNLDSLHLEHSSLPDDPATRLASRLARMKQNLLLGSLARAGIHVVNWNVTEPLNIALHFARFQERGRIHR